MRPGSCILGLHPASRLGKNRHVNITPGTLSPKTYEILGSIDDDALRADVEAAVLEATAALATLDRIHLPQDHFEERDATRASDDKHLELAPYVLAAVASLNRLLEVLGQRFPPPAQPEGASADFDFDFDLVDGPTGEGAGLAPEKDARAVHKTAREQAADAAYAFGSMLKSRVQSFAGRLRHALSQSDSWPLLAELDDYQHGLSKAVQGVLFGLLGVFSSDSRREEILPSYRSAVTEAVELRGALTHLTLHINRFNDALSKASQGQLVPLVVAIADRLARFTARAEYRTLRAEDKKAVIDFRTQLQQLRYSKNGIPQVPLRHAVEGFSKFLDAMGAINHREVLMVHDRQRLLEAIEKLEEARNLALAEPESGAARLLAIVKFLGVVYGRNPELDELLRNTSETPPADPLAALERFANTCKGTLPMVG